MSFHGVTHHDVLELHRLYAMRVELKTHIASARSESDKNVCITYPTGYNSRLRLVSVPAFEVRALLNRELQHIEDNIIKCGGLVD